MTDLLMTSFVNGPLGHIVIDCEAGIMSLYCCDIILFVLNGVSEKTAQRVTPLSLGSIVC